MKRILLLGYYIRVFLVSETPVSVDQLRSCCRSLDCSGLSISGLGFDGLGFRVQSLRSFLDFKRFREVSWDSRSPRVGNPIASILMRVMYRESQHNCP